MTRRLKVVAIAVAMTAAALTVATPTAQAAAPGCSTSHNVWLWCWVVNSHGNKWWWVRVAGKSTAGWMSDANMDVQPWDDGNDGNHYEVC